MQVSGVRGTPFFLISFLAFGACAGSVEPEQGSGGENVLPLSGGIQVAAHVSGGIAGLNDIIQVTDDWNLIVVSDGNSFVRRLDGDEQRAIRDILENFGLLVHGTSDGEAIADGMSVSLVARGWGSAGREAGEFEGAARATHSKNECLPHSCASRCSGTDAGTNCAFHPRASGDVGSSWCARRSSEPVCRDRTE